MLPTLFPNGRSAAVSLTYDDGLPEHFDHAMPDLETHGLRGTFYVPTRKAVVWEQRLDEWRAAPARGHELGNHTRHHPCSIKHAFMKARPNFTLEAYHLGRMERELLDASADLAELDGLPVRSFAYTCCEDFVGPEKTSFRPMVARLFPAARGGGKRELADPRACELSYVPSWAIIERDPIDELLAFVDDAVSAGAWAVFQFHGVGGGHNMNVAREAHQALCRHIAGRAADVWCDTFLHVARAVRAATGRRWEGAP